MPINIVERNKKLKEKEKKIKSVWEINDDRLNDLIIVDTSCTCEREFVVRSAYLNHSDRTTSAGF